MLWNDNEVASRQSMRELTGDDSAWSGYQQLLQLEAALAEIAWPSLMKPLRHRQEFLDRLTGADQIAAWDAFVEHPLGEVLEQLVENDVLRGLLMTDGKIGVFTHPHDPSLLQNRCFLYHVIGGGTGEWRVPVGGMKSLVQSLVERCRALGVQFAENATVRQVVPGSTEHEVVFEVDGQPQSVGAKDVLVNAGPKTFASLLRETWQPSPADEGSVVKMNMLLKRLPRLKSEVPPEHAFCGSLHLDEGYQWMRQSYEMASRCEVPNPAPCEVYCHSLTDPTILSPELQQAGFHTLTLFGLDMPYRTFVNDHEGKKQRVEQLYLEALDRICAEPIRECLALDRQGRPCIEIKTPQDLEREVDLDLGNIFHNQLTWFFTENTEEVGKWGVETKYPRIYRSGSAAARGGAVSGIPGYNAAQCVLSAHRSKFR